MILYYQYYHARFTNNADRVQILVTLVQGWVLNDHIDKYELVFVQVPPPITHY